MMHYEKRNFRPVFPRHHSKKQCPVFRSNSLDDGCYETVRWLKETIGLRSYVDLREQYEFNPNSKLNEFFHWREDSKKCDKNLTVDNQRHGNRFQVHFITSIAILKALIRTLSLLQLVKASILFIRHLFCRDWDYKSYFMKCFMQRITLTSFYCMLLTYCQAAFKTVFLIMTESGNFPILISCSMGKDRTGIVCAILMKLAGCSDQEVIEEYAKTEKLLMPMEKEINEFFKSRGINKEFKTSPPEAMQKVLKFLKEKYGGAEGYLRHCGLSIEDIDKIKRNIQNRTSE